jgi:hypothetical protein
MRTGGDCRSDVIFTGDVELDRNEVGVSDRLRAAYAGVDAPCSLVEQLAGELGAKATLARSRVQWNP